MSSAKHAKPRVPRVMMAILILAVITALIAGVFFVTARMALNDMSAAQPTVAAVQNTYSAQRVEYTPKQKAPPEARAATTPSVAPRRAATEAVPAPKEVKVIPKAAPPQQLTFPSGDAIAIQALPDESITPGNGGGLTIDPPENPAFAYWLAQHGMAGEGATDTVIVTAHSGETDQWMFNRLCDKNFLTTGDILKISTNKGDVQYKVAAIEHLPREKVASSSYISQSRPGELVLVSCWPDDLYAQNCLVAAKLIR